MRAALIAVCASLSLYIAALRQRILRSSVAVRIRKRIHRGRENRLNYQHIHNDSAGRKLL